MNKIVAYIISGVCAVLVIASVITCVVTNEDYVSANEEIKEEQEYLKELENDAKEEAEEIKADMAEMQASIDNYKLSTVSQDEINKDLEAKVAELYDQETVDDIRAAYYDDGETEDTDESTDDSTAEDTTEGE